MPTEWLNSRALAGLAGAVMLVGAALIVLSLGGRFAGGYVSEAGDPAAPYPNAYRAGVLALAVGLLLFGGALARISGLSAALVWAASGGAAVSGAVPCSPGCPLPPYETATVSDLVHAGASLAAGAIFTLALGVLGLSGRAGRLRVLARVGFAVLAPLGLTIVALMLAVGRSGITAALERAILVAALGWTLSACWLLMRRPPVAVADT